MTLFRRSSAVTCFYCLSLIDPHSPSSSHTRAFDPSSFRCLYCGCWNRYDSRGQIIGDEPAMHDELLNTESFSKRGTPDRNQLPSVTSQRSSSPFCRTCQTNQTLLINLRAAYLPDPEDLSYVTRMAQLPAYVASLQTRYPPVCASCLPGVEAEIARKDEYARTRALGGALKASSRPSSRAGGSNTATKASRAKLRTWKIRGVLWTASYFAAIVGNVAGIIQFRIPVLFQSFLPALVVISLAWTFWDPTFSLQQKSRVQGKQVRIGGRQRYIFLQGLAWISRLSTSTLIACSGVTPAWDFLHFREATPPNVFSIKRLYFEAALALELSVIVLSYFAITIHKPAPVRLIDTSAHRALSELSSANKSSSNINAQSNARANSVQPEPDFFATLSLSGNPVMAPVNVNPMFGQPSLAPGQASHTNGILDIDDEDGDDDDVLRRTRPRDPDAMDWEPSSPAKQASPHRKSRDDGTWLRQQRFFPPEEPTGLENLLMRARLVDEEEAARQRHRQQQQQGRELHAMPRRWSWGWVYSASVLPVVAVLAGLWLRSRS